MKIEKVKNENIKTFEELNVGEAFRFTNYFSTDLCIKTYEFICDTFFYDTEEEEDNKYNAIKLNNGEPVWFDNYTKVVIPNCKIVVE